MARTDAGRLLVKVDGALSRPGQFPFTSGIHPTMYRVREGGRIWTMRMFSGMGDARETNRRWKMLIAGGQTGLSTAYDDPTLSGIDPIHPQALGTVGKSGVHVSRLDDYRVLYEGIDVGRISSSQTVNGPAPLHYGGMVALADLRKVPRAALRGTTQTDILKEYLAQNEFIFPPGPSMRFIMDLMFFAAEHTPQWYPISISGYHIGEKGATQVEEVALTLADGLTYVEEGIGYGRRFGFDVDYFAPRLSFFFSAKPDFYQAIACFRAARRIWAREMRDTFHAANPKSQTLKFHTQTSGRSLTTDFTLNNIVRTALQALSAIFGGTQSLHTNSADEELGLPSELAVMAALHTQQVIAFETGIPEEADPFRGSVFMERLTDECEAKMLGIIAEVRSRGGMMTEEARRWALDLIFQSSLRAEQARESGAMRIIGRNVYPEGVKNTAAFNPFPETPIPPSVERRVVQDFLRWQKRRSHHKVARALDAVARAASSDGNVLPAVIDAEKARASFGEIVDVLRRIWGEHQQPIYVSPAATGLFKFSDENTARRDRLAARLGRSPKIYLTKIGIDFHDAGIARVAKMLREFGFTVVLGSGYRVSAEEVAKAALEEDVDLIGLNNLSNSYLDPTRKLLRILKDKGRGDVPVVLGGIIRFDTMKKLERMGVAGVARPPISDDHVIDMLLTLLERKYG